MIARTLELCPPPRQPVAGGAMHARSMSFKSHNPWPRYNFSARLASSTKVRMSSVHAEKNAFRDDQHLSHGAPASWRSGAFQGIQVQMRIDDFARAGQAHAVIRLGCDSVIGKERRRLFPQATKAGPTFCGNSQWCKNSDDSVPEIWRIHIQSSSDPPLFVWPDSKRDPVPTNFFFLSGFLVRLHTTAVRQGINLAATPPIDQTKAGAVLNANPASRPISVRGSTLLADLEPGAL